jgi:hypothetical protein
MSIYDQQNQSVNNQYNAGGNLYIVQKTTRFSTAGSKTGVSVSCGKYENEIAVLVSKESQQDAKIVYSSIVESNDKEVYKVDSDKSIFIEMEPHKNYQVKVWYAPAQEMLKPLKPPLAFEFQLNVGEIKGLSFEVPPLSPRRVFFPVPSENDNLQEIQDEPVNNSMTSSLITKAYDKLNEEIKQLRTKINQQGGLFIFKKHKYTIDELLESPHHNKIYATTEKLGSDIQNLHINGKLSKDEKRLYDSIRRIIEGQLREVNSEILRREPTWIEKIRKIFDGFIEMVMNNLPIIPANRLNEQKTTRRLPGFGFKNQGK